MKMHVSDRVRVADNPQKKPAHLPPTLGYGAAGNPLPENGERRTCKQIS